MYGQSKLQHPPRGLGYNEIIKEILEQEAVWNAETQGIPCAPAGAGSVVRGGGHAAAGTGSRRQAEQSRASADAASGRPEKVGLAAGGAAAALSLLHWAHYYRFYHSVIAKELKKQLAPLNKKLDELQAENERLRTELAAQKEHRP